MTPVKVNNLYICQDKEGENFLMMRDKNGGYWAVDNSIYAAGVEVKPIHPAFAQERLKGEK